MTRQPHDQFAKSLLSNFLQPLGKVDINREVQDATRWIDLYFEPDPTKDPGLLGLLGQMVQTPCLLEPYRNPVSADEIRDCLLKALTLQAQQKSPEGIPYLWILTPTLSDKLRQGFAAHPDPTGTPGLFRMPSELRAGLVVIHQLPRDPSTLWIRLLGRGQVQKQAIAEVLQMPLGDPKKLNTLELLGRWKIMLNDKQVALREDEQELILNLTPAYLEWRAITLNEGEQRGIHIGKQEGEADLTIRLLRRKLGSLAPSDETRIRALPVESLEALAEALLDFTHEGDLRNWLDPQEGST